MPIDLRHYQAELLGKLHIISVHRVKAFAKPIIVLKPMGFEERHDDERVFVCCYPLGSNLPVI
jgi:hypothetical protein